MKTGVSVMDAMTKQPVTIEPSATTTICAKKMKEYNIGSLIVKDKGSMLGIITEQDIIHRVIAEGSHPDEVLAKDIMSTDVVTLPPEADIYDAMVKMRDRSTRHVPVTHDGKLIGFLTLKDVLKIEPDLFDIIVEQFELREEERKPVLGERKSDMRTCEACGATTENIEKVYGSLLCEDCRESQLRNE